MAVAMEEWIVLFVFAELVVIGLIIFVSCWCCRSSVRRERKDDPNHTPIETHTSVTPRGVAHTTAGAAPVPGRRSNATDLTDATRVDDIDIDDENDNDGFVSSGGFWGFLTGFTRSAQRPTHRSSNTHTTTNIARSDGGVEVVNISVNTAFDDSDDKLGDDPRKSGIAA